MLDKTAETKQKIYSSAKKISLVLDQCCFQILGFWQQSLDRLIIDIGDTGKNCKFEKLSHSSNLLDFQLLYQQVLPKIVVKINMLVSLLFRAWVIFLEWVKHGHIVEFWGVLLPKLQI